MSANPLFWTKQGVTDTTAGLVTVTRDASGTITSRELDTTNPNLNLIRARIENGSYAIDAYGNLIRKTFTFTPATGVTISGTPAPYYTTKTNGLVTGGHWDFAPSGVCTFSVSGGGSGDGNKLCAVGTADSTTLQFYDGGEDWPGRETLIATAVMSSTETVVGQVQDAMLAIQSGRMSDYDSSRETDYTVGTWIRHEGDLYVCIEEFSPSGQAWSAVMNKFVSMGTVESLFGTQNATLAATIDTKIQGKQDTSNLVTSTDATTVDDDTHYPSTARMAAKAVMKTGETSQSVSGELIVGDLNVVGGTKFEIVSSASEATASDTLYFITGS